MDPKGRPTPADGNDPLRNKNETELPIGEPQHPENREPHLWRCGVCGNIGEFDGAMPETCVECHAPKEELSYVDQD